MASALLCAPAAMSASASGDCKIKDILSNISQYTCNQSTSEKTCNILDALGVDFKISDIEDKLSGENLKLGIFDLLIKDEKSPEQSDKTEQGDKNDSTDKKEESEKLQTEASDLAWQVIELVNSYRAEHGISPVKYDAAATCAAQTRAREIVSVFSHTRPDGKRCFTALDECGANYQGAGENIAMGQTTAKEVMNDWMNSAGHRENILNENFTKIGVGVYQGDDGRLYWTQMFVY